MTRRSSESVPYTPARTRVGNVPLGKAEHTDLSLGERKKLSLGERKSKKAFPREFPNARASLPPKGEREGKPLCSPPFHGSGVPSSPTNSQTHKHGAHMTAYEIEERIIWAVCTAALVWVWANVAAAIAEWIGGAA